MIDDNKLEDLAKRFAEKNPLFIRVAMENHYTEHTCLIISQGKITKWEYKAHAKEIR